MKVRFAERFGWSRVATIRGASDYFASIVKDFIDVSSNLTIVGAEVVPDGESPQAALDNLRRKDVRIFFVSMYEEQFADLYCAAYRMGLVGER